MGIMGFMPYGIPQSAVSCFLYVQNFFWMNN